MSLFTWALGFAVQGSSFTDVARDINTSVHVHIEAQQASCKPHFLEYLDFVMLKCVAVEIPSLGSCSRKRNCGSDKDKDNTLQVRSFTGAVYYVIADHSH